MRRPLSNIEQVNWLIDRVVSISFVMIARVSGEITESILRKALDILQEKHPPLKWKIKEGETPEFDSDGVPPIPLRIVKRRDNQHWIEEADKEINMQFQWDKGPLLRVVQMAGSGICELLITFCHVATDATSGVLVVKELLTLIDKLSKGETVPMPEPRPIPLSSVELVKKELIPEIRPDEEGEKDTKPETVVLKGDQDVPPEQRKTRTIHHTFNREETKKLVALCKENKTSVHGALCAAFFQSVVHEIRQQGEVPQSGPLTISCVTPVDIRQHFSKPVEEDIGYYISFALHFQDIDENGSLWKPAREIKEAIVKEIKAGKDIQAIMAVGDQWKQYDTPLDMVRGQNSSYPPVVATNLGRLNIAEQFGNLTLEELHYTVAISSVTRSGLGFAVTTHRGHLTINFLYTEPYISAPMAHKLVENSMRRLRDVLR